MLNGFKFWFSNEYRQHFPCQNQLKQFPLSKDKTIPLGLKSSGMGETISIEQKKILTPLGFFFHFQYQYIQNKYIFKSSLPPAAITIEEGLHPTFCYQLIILEYLCDGIFFMLYQRFKGVSLYLLLFLFISVVLFVNCLLINVRWYIHFGLYIISMYVVLVPWFKDHRGLVYSCSFVRK